MSFRFLQTGTQFLTNDGEVLAGGSLTFSISGTTTPKTTWSDPDMTTENSDPVTLDAAGRPDTDIWGDGSYRVVLKDSLGATIVTRDDVSGPFGIPDPAGQSGEFLTNDGTDLSWTPILQVPDPTGQADGNILTTDGTNYAWEVPASASFRQVPDPTDITDGWVVTRDDASTDDYKWAAPPGEASRAWYDVESSRTPETLYQNETDRDMEVSIGVTLQRYSWAYIYQGNFTPPHARFENLNGEGILICTLQATIPAGETYRLSIGGSQGYGIIFWNEYRDDA